MKEKIHNLFQDNLFLNSLFLMMSTGVQAFFGFVFWLLVAHLYTPTEVGIGSTLLSAAIFISYISLLGFNSTLIKFLPASKRRTEKINSSLILVFCAAIIVSLTYVISLPYLVPQLSFLSQSYILSFTFILLSAFSALNLLADSIFIAYRAAKYNFYIYTIQSIIKLILPIALVTFGAFGVFASSGLATTIALVLSIYFLITKFEYSPKLFLSTDVLKNLWKSSSANYISNLFNILPTITIPIIIVNKLGAAQAGYYYLAFMLANLLYSIAYAVSQSLFAEGSYGDTKLHLLFRRAVIILSAIMIPAGVALSFVGPLLLQFFGKSYSEEASRVIVVLALAAPVIATYILSSVFLRITNRIYVLIVVNLTYAVTISGLAYFWAERGLIWVGFAWIIGHLAAIGISIVAITYTHYRGVVRIPA